MKTNISEHDFREGFRTLRPENFSYEGLGVLFEYLEQMEEDCDMGIEFDVIALCCDYSEMTLEEIYSDYIYAENCGNKHFYDVDAHDALADLPDQEEWSEWITDWLQERTTVIRVNDDTVIIQAF